MSLGNQFPVFQDCVVVSSSRVKIFNKRPSCPKCVSDLAFFVDILILTDKTTTLPQKVKIQLPSDMASYPRKTETSSMLLQKPKNSFFLHFVFS
jgi:hypothetical protein